MTALLLWGVALAVTVTPTRTSSPSRRGASVGISFPSPSSTPTRSGLTAPSRQFVRSLSPTTSPTKHTAQASSRGFVVRSLGPLEPLVSQDAQYLRDMAQFNSFVLKACDFATDPQSGQAVTTLANSISSDHVELGSEVNAAAQAATPPVQLPPGPNACQQELLSQMQGSPDPGPTWVRIMTEQHAVALNLTRQEVRALCVFSHGCRYRTAGVYRAISKL